LRKTTRTRLNLLPWVVVVAGLALSTRVASAETSHDGPPAPFPSSSLTDKLAVVTPVCLDRSDIPPEEMHWLYFPKSASELATHQDYAYLSGQLIQNRIVDASDCPLGGLWPDGYANACGLAKTRQASIYLQNVYDDAILAAGKDTGVPPAMMKQLIRYESQFWPVQWGVYHFGLGHLTQMGAATAIFWNRALYEAVAGVEPSSVNLPTSLVSLMNASCPTCQYGIDIPKAERSVPLIAQTLMAYCRQTTQIVYNATKVSPADVVDYPTIWKLTLLNYNAGPNCAFDAVKQNYHFGTKLDWVGIADNLAVNMCVRGVAYTDTITAPYYEFPGIP
jgi:hypothetical protein